MFLSFCVLDDFFCFSKKSGFWVFLVHPPMALVLLSASVERCFVSRMRDFFNELWNFGNVDLTEKNVFTYFASFTDYEDDIFEVISNLHVQRSKFGGKITKFSWIFLKLNSREFMKFVYFMSAQVLDLNLVRRPCKITRTYDCHLESLKRSAIPHIGCFWSPLTHRVEILQKKSHITYYIGICKFYKISVINTVVTFNNSSKLILKTFDEYYLIEIITLTKQTPMSGLKLVKPTISRWNKALSEKFSFAQKSWKSKILVCVFSSLI